ncbi:MAG: hypothetical protein HC871_13055 [Rhizobiales bacterium]|nr:hypothetical protein [Hyphomicrobiales bacterium]
MSSSKRAGFSNRGAASLLQRAAVQGARWIVLLTLGAASLVAPATAASFDAMLTATPLVLKDGRIAEVLVHAVPFPDDAVAPSSTIQQQLQSFTKSIATDCFLTAQVIGHVDKSEISGRETADIHRLARARADTIQSSLVGNGLPAASIASVWDWRFMVQQARVTLWVFRLTAGEDCENAPLDHQTEDLVADASPAKESPGTADTEQAGSVAADRRSRSRPQPWSSSRSFRRPSQRLAARARPCRAKSPRSRRPSGPRPSSRKMKARCRLPRSARPMRASI